MLTAEKAFQNACRFALAAIQIASCVPRLIGKFSCGNGKEGSPILMTNYSITEVKLIGPLSRVGGNPTRSVLLRPTGNYP